MAQTGQNLGFALQIALKRGILTTKIFDCDLMIKLLIEGGIDRAHTTLAN